MRQQQNTALKAKTEQFITAEISGKALKQGVEHTQWYGSALKQWSKTHSTLRQGNSQLQDTRLRECLVEQ